MHLVKHHCVQAIRNIEILVQCPWIKYFREDCILGFRELVLTRSVGHESPELSTGDSCCGARRIALHKVSHNIRTTQFCFHEDLGFFGGCGWSQSIQIDYKCKGFIIHKSQGEPLMEVWICDANDETNSPSLPSWAIWYPQEANKSFIVCIQ